MCCQFRSNILCGSTTMKSHIYLLLVITATSAVQSEELVEESQNGQKDPQAKREPRTLGVIADIFLTSVCKESDCRRSIDRSNFCCKRNFNSICCMYLFPSPVGPPLDSLDQAWSPIQSVFNSYTNNLGGLAGTGSVQPGYWQFEKPGACPPAKFPHDYHDDYYTRGLNHYRPGYSAAVDPYGCTACGTSNFLPYSVFDYGYPPYGDPIFFPGSDYIRKKRKSVEMQQYKHGHPQQQPEVAYKVLKKRSKMITFEDEEMPDYMKTSSTDEQHRERERIPEMLTPQSSSNNRFFFPTRNIFGTYGDETCRYDNDCFGVQKCCHVQVSKYRFKLGCRHPRTFF